MGRLELLVGGEERSVAVGLERRDIRPVRFYSVRGGSVLVFRSIEHPTPEGRRDFRPSRGRWVTEPDPRTPHGEIGRPLLTS